MNKASPAKPFKEADKAVIAKQALLKLKELKAKLDDIERARHAPLAVVGMACNFPGGIKSPEDYWQALVDGQDLIGEMSQRRRDLLPEALPEAAEHVGGYLEDIDKFDAAFFGFSPREAERTDPQQRMFLTTAWKALEDAALNPNRLKGTKVGVYAGLSMHDYSNLISRYPELYGIDGQDPAGLGGCFVSGRLSHTLGVHGPSVTVDTACSSSLTAIHMAALSLRTGDCDVALAGGVNLVLYPEMTATFAKAGMLSSNGRCNAFGANADGFTRGEGCGVVVLKTLDAALANGDPIRAVLYGTAVNQDGPSSGPTTPYGPAQCDLHGAVLNDASAQPENVVYFETHGTGTALGDPIEFSALSETFGAAHGEENPLWIGSVKSNFGHLEAAAGVAGFMKAALIAQYGQIPPSLHNTPLSNHINWQDHPIKVAQSVQDLPKTDPSDDDRILIGVSSFGLSGTNAGALLGPLHRTHAEESATDVEERPSTLLISASSESALKEQSDHWLKALNADQSDDLDAFCRTSRMGRAHGPISASITATSRQDMRSRLEALSANGRDTMPEGGVAFLFSGQSTQYPFMGQELYKTEPVYRQTFDTCAGAMQDVLPFGLHDIVFPENDGPLEAERLSHARLAQAALFATSTSLAELAKSYGVQPDIVIGHSIGEFAASVQAGILSIEDGARLAALRGKILSDIEPRGTMCAVFNLEQDLVEAVLKSQKSDVVISVFNGPQQMVLAGMEQSLRDVTPALEAAGGKVVAMQMLQAYHTPCVAEACAPFEAEMRKVELHSPHIPIFSTLLAARGDEAMCDHSYWSRQIVSPVRFSDAVKAAIEHAPFRLALEMGPHAVLAPLTESIFAATQPDGKAVPNVSATLVRGEPAQATFQTALAKSSSAGCTVNWDACPDRGPRLGGLPGRHFEERPYWLRALGSGQVKSAQPAIVAEASHTTVQAQPQKRLETPEERRDYVLNALADALHISKDELGEVRDFFDIGLNSIHAIEVAELWEKDLGVTVDVGQLLATSTLAGWIEALDGELAKGTPESAALSEETISDELDGRLALTAVQKAYWVGRNPQLPLGGVACYMYQEFDGGSVTPDNFRAAVTRLIARHEMLRAVVDADGYVRILTEGTDAKPDILDLRKESAKSAELQLKTRRDTMKAKCADPAQWPLFELSLSLLPDGKSRVHLGLDMLIADAASVAILVQELDKLCADPKVELPTIATTISQALAQVERKQPRDSSRSYWLERLPQLPNGPNLPLAQEPENLSAHSFKRLSHKMNASRWQALKEACKSHRVTPTAMFVALFSRVLARWSEEAHFCLTLTQFGRPSGQSGADRLIGDFTTLALLECKPDGADSFEASVKTVMQQLQADLGHRDFTALDLLRHAAEIDPTRIPNVPVVFTSALGVEETADSTRFDCLGNWGWGLSQTPQVWLDHQLFEVDGQLILQWDFVEDLFPKALIEAMFSAYEQLIDGLLSLEGDWNAKLPAALPNGQVTRRQEVNATAKKYDSALLHDQILEHGNVHPDAPAILTANGAQSYQDLLASARNIAACLQDQGISTGDRVAIRLPKSADQIAAALAILMAGAVFVPLSQDWPKDRCETVIRNSGAQIMIADTKEDWPITILHPQTKTTSSYSPDVECAPSDPAYVIYTSGSTGAPKGVVVSHNAALNTILDVNERLGIGPQDRVLALSSLSFDLSVYDVFGLLRAGGALVLPDEAHRRDPQHWVELVRKHKVTLWNSVPVLLDLYLTHLEGLKEKAPKHLRSGWLSGDWISLDLVARARRVCPHTRLIGSGGATEAGIWSNWYEISELPTDAQSVPYGKPLANQKYHVLDKALQDRPDWVPGDLFIAGDSLADGYFGDAEKTDAAFFAHPRTGERLYATGDIGRYLPDGNLQFLGRVDSQVKIGGFRVELGDVNAALGNVPFVDKAIAFTIGEKAAKSLAAAVVWKQGTASNCADLAEELGQHLPSYMVPVQFVELEELPLTANAKVDMARLQNLATQNRGSKGPQVENGVLDQAAKLVCSLIEGQLNLSNLSLADNLLALGATSVDIIRLASALQSDLGVKPRVNDLMRLTNVGELVEYCRPTLEKNGLIAGYSVSEGTFTTERDILGVTDILDRHPVLTDPDERKTFSLRLNDQRADLAGLERVDLPAMSAATPDSPALARYSCRDYAPTPVSLSAFGNLMEVLRPVLTQTKRKYAYGSAGGMYPVQTYVSISNDRIENIPGGCYTLDVEQGNLVRLDDAAVDLSALSMSSHSWNANCAFGIFLVCDLARIAPVYGDDAVRFSIMEAGAMAAILELAACRNGLGLCQIGDVDFAAVRNRFKLHRDHYFLQALFGGTPGKEADIPRPISNQSLEHGEI